MARTTRASLELIVDDPKRPQWLDWIASSRPELRDADGNPIVKYIAEAGGMPYQTLYPIARGRRTPTLEVTGEIIAVGAYLHGVDEDTARRHILRMVHRPIAEATAA